MGKTPSVLVTPAIPLILSNAHAATRIDGDAVRVLPVRSDVGNDCCENANGMNISRVGTSKRFLDIYVLHTVGK